MITIRKLSENELAPALELAWQVFLAYEAPDYAPSGTEEFRKSIHDPAFMAQLQGYGAFCGDDLLGMLATRSGGSHIALFFVEGKYHRQGIGRRLFEAARQNCSTAKMTVNSSPFAVPVYRRLGFSATAEEQTVNGIRFTPMEINL